MEKAPGTLFLVATPIGNLNDITIRALDILKRVDLIAAEDTRRTRKLLSYFDIHTPLISFHEHNKVHQGKKLLEKLQSGTQIALCSDAGMPVISDPGEDFVRLCIENNIHVTVVPGANAALSGLVISGLSANTFLYLGFIPRKKKRSAEFLQSIAKEAHTLIFYESPHRITELLERLLESLGDRKACAIREITKIHEEAIRGKIGEILENLRNREIMGEFTLVVEGAMPEEKDDYFNPANAATKVKELMDSGLPKKDAIKEAAVFFNVSKRVIYNICIEYENQSLNGIS